MIKRVNDHGLEEAVLESKGFLVALFFQATSIPCNHFSPEIEAVAEAMNGRATFLKIDAQENPTITDDLGVTAMPTVLVFKDGDEVARYEGPYSKEAIVGRLSDLMKAKKGKGAT